MRDFRLRSRETVQTLIDASDAQLVVFKPICDSHYGDEALQRHPNSRLIWIYRRYQDVVNSILRKWPGHSREVMDRFHDGDTQWLGWRAERLDAVQLEEIRALWRPDLSPHESAAIFWYLRNSFFFHEALAEHADSCQLLCYEDLVTDPERQFSAIFGCLDLPFSAGLVAAVSAGSVGREAFPDLAPEITALCDGLMERLALAH